MPRDKDFAWFERECNERLGPLQQARGGAVLDLSHVVQTFGGEFAVELSDEGIAEALEHVERHSNPIYRKFRGQLRAEQSRRQADINRSTIRLMGWTLFFAAVGAVAAVIAIFS